MFLANDAKTEKDTGLRTVARYASFCSSVSVSVFVSVPVSLAGDAFLGSSRFLCLINVVAFFRLSLGVDPATERCQKLGSVFVGCAQ